MTVNKQTIILRLPEEVRADLIMAGNDLTLLLVQEARRLHEKSKDRERGLTLDESRQLALYVQVYKNLTEIEQKEMDNIKENAENMTVEELEEQQKKLSKKLGLK